MKIGEYAGKSKKKQEHAGISRKTLRKPPWVVLGQIRKLRETQEIHEDAKRLEIWKSLANEKKRALLTGHAPPCREDVLKAPKAKAKKQARKLDRLESALK